MVYHIKHSNHRGVSYHVAVVVAKPEAGSDLTGQAGTHLGDETPCRLLGGDGAFVEVLYVVDLIRERRRAIRHLEDTAADIAVEGEGVPS